LRISALDLDVSVVEVGWSVMQVDGLWQSIWQTADGAAGHHRNSANPGEAGNVVISGHHNTRGEVLRALSEVGRSGNDLRPGDEVVLVAEDGRSYSYRVDNWVRFEEEGATQGQIREHARYLEPTQDARLTLVTCWPYESNTHRVVVLASLIP
jgi:LPXTG-site transpeptidase (sortase) family protein